MSIVHTNTYNLSNNWTICFITQSSSETINNNSLLFKRANYIKSMLIEQCRGCRNVGQVIVLVSKEDNEAIHLTELLMLTKQLHTHL